MTLVAKYSALVAKQCHDLSVIGIQYGFDELAYNVFLETKPFACMKDSLTYHFGFGLSPDSYWLAHSDRFLMYHLLA